MAETATATAKPNLDKREAILAAALRLIARFGLHNAPMSAVAREAGIAVGTVYLYFPSKEAMINALYLHVLEERNSFWRREPPAATDSPPDARAALWETWHTLARWHLEHEEGSNLIAQCRASGILSDETRAFEQSMDARALVLYEQAVAEGHLRSMPRYVLWALLAGPVYALVQMRDAGETEITEEILRETFDGVCRALLP
ncbi:MAG TPA: TetR/AcrR family transcriptional regulator [Gemmatimonadaceae bacterium]